MAEQVTGVVERITFHNLDNGYCVLRVLAPGHRDLVTVVGHTQQVVAGEYVSASGEWTTDRTHGQQFKASEIKTNPPHTAEGIAKYLGSGLIKGIGPKFAQRIVDVFKESTLEVLEKSPTFLTQVKGIGVKMIEKIRKSWEEQRESRKIMVFLQSHGIGTARAVRIYKTYGDQAIELIKANPYRLSADIWGVGFATADELAKRLGIPPDSPFRAQAVVRHVLSEASGDGHVGYPEELLCARAVEMTEIPEGGIREAIEQLIKPEIGEAVRDSTRAASGGRESPDSVGATEVSGDSRPPLAEENLIFLKSLFLAELGTARAIKALAKGPHPLPAVDMSPAIAWVEKKMNIQLAGSQRVAIQEAVANKMVVVTGGPGTGKTTIVRAIIEIFLAKSLRVLLCAPTGRAAKRLTESTGREAKTIHRLLEFDPGVGGFKRGRENPLDADLLVVDETSMADLTLTNQLLRAIPAWACVVFVGDRDQLPSVGAGRVLADFIDSGTVAVVRLTEVHRQAGSSYIVRAAHAVNRGEEPESAPARQGDFFIVEADEPTAVLERIVTMVKERIPAKFHLDPFRDVQVLSPMNKSELGVHNLNAVLQAALNPQQDRNQEVARFGVTFRRGDKVIQTQNNYQREVFNGDIGRITDVDAVNQALSVDFEGRDVEYDFGDLDELQLAYCTSIHKSQGSEYPAVIIPVHTQHYVMLQRNLLYTGITRGRKLVVLVGSKKALWIAVNKTDQARRYSLLHWRLQAGHIME